MAKARRRVKSLEPQWRFCFPTAVEFDPESDRIIVADSMRNRLQVYQKVRNTATSKRTFSNPYDARCRRFARRHRARAILLIGLGRSYGLEYLAPPRLLRARRVRLVDQSMLASTKPGSAAAPGREGDGGGGWGDAIGSPFNAPPP